MVIGETIVTWSVLFELTRFPLLIALFVGISAPFIRRGKSALPVTDNQNRPEIEWVKE